MTVSQFPPKASFLQTSMPYVAYTYSYPHKTAYRPLSPALHLGEVWAAEAVDALFLYVHLPFCEMRCGFCNLFTTPNPAGDVVDDYLAVLERQCSQVKRAIGPAAFARGAVGGGTPTYLSARQMERLFNMMDRVFSVDLRQVPTSVETSPRTAEDDKLRLLKERGVTRISIGVQSMIDAEVNAAGRAQKEQWVSAAIERIRKHEFATLNIDLIYGLPSQTVGSWQKSLEGVLHFRPEELYLYPLYVRPLTGLDRRFDRPEDPLRLDCYRAARETLLANGYEQLSMRMFRAAAAPKCGGPVYCCQEDGMVGVGCGARSYTTGLHYSSEYAVGATGVKSILRDYLQKTDAQLDRVDYGCRLDESEQKRRYVIKSLLRSEGLDKGTYSARFESEVEVDLPEILDLVEAGLVTNRNRLQLSVAGMERSDAVGPYLYSASVRQMMDNYELR